MIRPVTKISVLNRLQFLAGVALVVAAFLNLGQFHHSLAILPIREQEEMVVWETRLSGIRYALTLAQYESGAPVGYISGAALRGLPSTPEHSTRWAQARYVMIPWNVVQDTMEARYVIVDSSGENVNVEVPAGFTKVYDSGDGLLLLQRIPL